MSETNIKSHRDLIAWQKAMTLAESVYKLAGKFPREEVYGLTSQVKRSVTSIPANIAEGQGRRSKKEFQQFLGHARGSLLELDTHLELALRFNYINIEEYRNVYPQIQEVGRLVNGLLRSLND
ncbi:MAG TPA: four helix bundle protein [Pyrinomonadaceae bacterium]|jgi:four helix bundle protein|nr:four helix bundle protein [Pyrinomonadaceae bacterium]